MAHDLFLGACIHLNDVGLSGTAPLDHALLRTAGITWTRVDLPFPFAGMMGTVAARYREVAASIRDLHERGIRCLGITPYAHSWPVSDAGEPGSQTFLTNYRAACAFLAADLADVIDTWQVCNEMNLGYYRRPFVTEEECLPFLTYGGLGIREGNPNAQVGVNMATGHVASADRMYRAMYPSNTVQWDFVGVDAYYGTWEKGGPDEWKAVLDHIHVLCGVDIIVMEYGYASAGGSLTDAERGDQELSSSALHTLSKWPYAWAEGHTPEVQGRYCSEALAIFRDHPAVRGAFWYKWNDGRKCTCGTMGCPENSAYGMVTIDQQPKPAYLAHQEFAKGLGRTKGRQAAAFTLMELLVTVTVIALLLSLLFPVINMVREKAKDVRCRGNLRQVGIGIMVYASDNDGFTPSSVLKISGKITQWTELLGPYIEKGATKNRGGAGIMYGCPAWRGWYAPGNLPGYQWDLEIGDTTGTRDAAGYAYNNKPGTGTTNQTNGFSDWQSDNFDVSGNSRRKFKQFRLAQIMFPDNRMACGDANYWNLQDYGATTIEFHLSSADQKSFNMIQLPGQKLPRHQKNPRACNYVMFSGRVASLTSVNPATGSGGQAKVSYENPSQLK